MDYYDIKLSISEISKFIAETSNKLTDSRLTASQISEIYKDTSNTITRIFVVIVCLDFLKTQLDEKALKQTAWMYESEIEKLCETANFLITANRYLTKQDTVVYN